jgi:hypothetical protein
MADEVNVRMSIESRGNRDALRALLDALDAVDDREISYVEWQRLEKEFSRRRESDVRREPDTPVMGDYSSPPNLADPSGSAPFPSASAGHPVVSDGPSGTLPPARGCAEGWPTSVDETPSEPLASTPQGADAPGITGMGSAPAGAEVVGHERGGAFTPPAAAVPEEDEGASAPESATGESPAQDTDPATPVAEVGKAPAGIPAPAGAPDWDELVAQVVIDGMEPAEVAHDGMVHVGDLRRHIKRVRDARRRGGRLTGRLAPKEDQPGLIDPAADVEQAEQPTAEEAPAYDHIANLCGMVEKGLGTVTEIARKHDADPRTIKARLESRAIAREAEAAKAAIWTPERDLMLAETILEGPGGFDPAADALGLPRDKVVERWNELLPTKGYREQELLMKRLRAKAGALA